MAKGQAKPNKEKKKPKSDKDKPKAVSAYKAAQSMSAPSTPFNKKG